MAGKGIDAGRAARCAHAGRNRRTAGDVYIVGQNEMAGNHGRPANGTTPPDGGGPGDSDTGRYRGVRSDPDVVRIHDLIVQLDAVSNPGVVDLAPVEHGARKSQSRNPITTRHTVSRILLE